MKINPQKIFGAFVKELFRQNDNRMTTRMTIREWKAQQARSKVRKAKRKAKARQIWGKQRALPLSAIKEKLWSLISIYVRLRDKRIWNGKCLICWKNPIEVAYHIVPANEGSAAKWDYEENIVGACRACNYEEFRFRRKYNEIHHQLFGEEKMWKLENKARQIVKYGRADYLQMIEDVKQKTMGLLVRQKSFGDIRA